MTTVTPGREELLAKLSGIDRDLKGLLQAARAGDSFTQLAIHIGGLMVDAEEAARLAAKPADDGVRELKQRIHNLRVTLSSVVTLAESAPVNLKTQNAIAKAAKHSLDRDASTPGAPKQC